MVQTITPALARIPMARVNAWFLGRPGGPWALADTGTPGRASLILAAAAQRFGADARPEAIFLTHGHFDHAGSTAALAEHWQVPIYAHPLELPYLTGRSDYPPPDPTLGGAIGLLARFLPFAGRDLGPRLRSLPADDDARHTGPLPGLDGWRWVHTPGHAPGHVAFIQDDDGTVVAGDAVATLDLQSWLGLLTERAEIAAGGPPFICDWAAYARSLTELAALRPVTLACGHGRPLAGPGVADALDSFARRFTRPPHGRYVAQAAATDERGIDWLPPRPADPFWFLVAAGLGGLAFGLGLAQRTGREKDGS